MQRPGVPLVPVGFMYPEGYLRQKIRADGWQEGVDEVWTGMLRRSREFSTAVGPTGDQGTLSTHRSRWLFGRDGRSGYLYLLDTDIAMNDHGTGGSSAHLYIGDIEQRLRQEIVLGIGGSEVLILWVSGTQCSMLNEGHRPLPSGTNQGTGTGRHELQGCSAAGTGHLRVYDAYIGACRT